MLVMLECEQPSKVVIYLAALTTQPTREVAMALSHSSCSVCGRQFKSYNPTPTFCSKACKDKSQEAVFDLDAAVVMYESGASQVEVAEYFCVTQKAIWAAFRRRGVKARLAIKRNQRGDIYASRSFVARHPGARYAQLRQQNDLNGRTSLETTPIRRITSGCVDHVIASTMA